MIAKLHIASWQERRLLCQRGNTLKQPPLTSRRSLGQSHTPSVQKRELSAFIKKAQNTIFSAGWLLWKPPPLTDTARTLQEGVSKQHVVLSRALPILLPWSLGPTASNTLWWWLNSSNHVKELLLIYAYQVPCHIATCPRHRLLLQHSWGGTRTIGYHQRQGEHSSETSPDKASDLTTFRLAIPPFLDTQSHLLHDSGPNFLCIWSAKFPLALPRGKKTSNSIFSRALLKHASSLVFVAQQHTKMLKHEL